jgi:hypothetical protein
MFHFRPNRIPKWTNGWGQVKTLTIHSSGECHIRILCGYELIYHRVRLGLLLSREAVIAGFAFSFVVRQRHPDHDTAADTEECMTRIRRALLWQVTEDATFFRKTRRPLLERVWR